MNDRERKEILFHLAKIDEALRGIRGIVNADLDDRGINQDCVREILRYVRGIRFNVHDVMRVIPKYHDTSSPQSSMGTAYSYIRYMVKENLIEPIGSFNGKTLYRVVDSDDRRRP